MNKRKIYLASSWKNKLQPLVLKLLLRMGHDAYDFRNPNPGDNGFAWEEIDPNWQQWKNQDWIKALGTQRATDGFINDFKAMDWADTFVLLLPCGRSAHLEAGWAKGQGKEVIIVMLDEEQPELMYLMCDKIITSEHELMKHFTIDKPTKKRSSHTGAKKGHKGK